MPDILDDARFQFDSAEKKLETVNELIDAFIKTDPYTFVVNRNPASGEYVFRAKVRTQPDRPLLQAIKDTIHDVRVGLDYIAFAFAEKIGTPPDGTEFPIFWNPSHFINLDSKGLPKKGSGLYKIRGIDPSIQTAIQGLQPFAESTNDPKGHPLWMIQELDIISKHRKPLITGAVANVGLGIGSGYISRMDTNWGGPEAAIKPGAFQDGAILGRIAAAPGTNVNVKLIPTYDVAFDKAGPGRGEMTRDTLRRLIEHVQGHVLPQLEVFV